MNQAVKPDFFNLPTFKKEQEAKEKGISEEERQIYVMSQTAGWMRLKEHLNSLITDLDSFNDNAISSGAGMEEIGKNAIVISLVKGIIKKSLNRVEDAKEACEKPDGTDK